MAFFIIIHLQFEVEKHFFSALGNIKVVFLSSFEEITYLSYCIRDNPLKEKELCAETWLFFFLLISYCSTAIYQHQKNKDYDL